MTVAFILIDVVLHVMQARVILCMLMLVVVHVLANLVSVARVAHVLRVCEVHCVVAVHRVDRSIENDWVVFRVRRSASFWVAVAGRARRSDCGPRCVCCLPQGADDSC
jgi:hypothetical protein